MIELDEKFIDFIKEHHVLNIASSKDNQPYIAHCFYAYDKKNNVFYFTSDPATRHGNEFVINDLAAAGIALETTTIGKIQGLQMTGRVVALEGEDLKRSKKKYLRAFPYALLKLETMWGFYPNFMKLTDNRLGFGTKLKWEK